MEKKLLSKRKTASCTRAEKSKQRILRSSAFPEYKNPLHLYLPTLCREAPEYTYLYIYTRKCAREFFARPTISPGFFHLAGELFFLERGALGFEV